MPQSKKNFIMFKKTTTNMLFGMNIYDVQIPLFPNKIRLINLKYHPVQYPVRI